MIGKQSSSLPVGQRGERVTRRAVTSAANEGPRRGGVYSRGAAALSGLQPTVGDLIAQLCRIVIIESRRMMCI
jgi:hypothetical protein